MKFLTAFFKAIQIRLVSVSLTFVSFAIVAKMTTDYLVLVNELKRFVFVGEKSRKNKVVVVAHVGVTCFGKCDKFSVSSSRNLNSPELSIGPMTQAFSHGILKCALNAHAMILVSTIRKP
jgi:hypothetical protein